MSTEQEQDAGGLIPALLAVYGFYLAWRAANGDLPRIWGEVVTALHLQATLGDQLAMIAARALARQREGLGAGAEELWTGVPVGVADGVDAGLQTVAEALIWTDEHEIIDTKDAESITPTREHPPVDLAMLVAQATAAAAQESCAAAAGWRYKTWHTVGDTQVRETHRVLGGTRIPLSDVFRTTDGDTLRYPGDPQASISNRIGCRCALLTSR